MAPLSSSPLVHLGDLPLLVTGCAGLIGSNLCARLLALGHKVIGVDNFYTSSPKNIAAMTTNPAFRFINHDVTAPLIVDVAGIFNLACPASPKYYQIDPIFTTKTCVLGSLNMLGLAKSQNCPILLSSTSEIYGDPLVHPQSETYWGNVNTVGPRSCYDEGKRCAETLFYNYHHHLRLPTKIVRIFNTYGPNLHPDDGRVISNFILQALRGQDLTLYGDGQKTRSFCYVDDLVEGMIRFMATPADVAGPLNLGNPEEVTVRHLAELVLELTGSSSKIVELPALKDDPFRRCPDITEAKRLLGWTPTVPLREGLAHTIAYFKNKMQETR